VTNRLKILRRVKTERNEHEKTEEIVVAEHVGGREKGREKDRWIQ